MPKHITDFGKRFKEKFNYNGKLTKECMGTELWNEYCKATVHNRWTRPEHIESKEQRKEERKIQTEKNRKKRYEEGSKYSRYCKDFKLIENYELAKADNFKGWVCHHRLENMFTAEELQKMNLYFNVKPGELIFIKREDHSANPHLHIGCKKAKASKALKISQILEKYLNFGQLAFI